MYTFQSFSQLLIHDVIYIYLMHICINVYVKHNRAAYLYKSFTNMLSAFYMPYTQHTCAPYLVQIFFFRNFDIIS